jgi:hypothetical protein
VEWVEAIIVEDKILEIDCGSSQVHYMVKGF